MVSKSFGTRLTERRGVTAQSDTDLNISNSGAQYRKVGGFLIIGRGGQLSLEEFEALLEVSSAVLLELVVHFPRAGTGGAATAASAATAIAAATATAITADRRRGRDGGWPVGNRKTDK